jgi:D-alanyl-D-alanine carboxypeptidase
MPSRRVATTILISSLVLGAVACGDGGSGGETSTTVQPATTVAAVTFDAATEAALETAFDTSFDGSEAPGAIVAVRKGDQTWISIRGVTDTTPSGTAPTVDEHSRIGSVTKTLTGTLILQLVDQGRLSLDDTIEAWFPELPDAAQITVRDLGSMSSGIDSYTADATTTSEYFANPQREWTSSELIAAAVALPRKFPPGEGFQYSNTNFLMLGEIIEKVTGMSIAEAMQIMIFDELGLEQTSWPNDNTLPDPHWQGYTDQTGPIVDATDWSPTFAGAAGQLVSDLGDLLVWTEALGTGSLLSAESQQARLEPNPASVSGVRSYNFAVGTDNGWLAHDGQIPGFNTQVAYLPSEDITIVVLTNADVTGASGIPAPTIFKALASTIAPANAP